MKNRVIKLAKRSKKITSKALSKITPTKTFLIEFLSFKERETLAPISPILAGVTNPNKVLKKII